MIVGVIHILYGIAVHLVDYIQFIEDVAFTAVEVWADCGPHFRSYEFAHAVLIGLPRNHASIVNTSLNFFCEKHGKGRCDGAFGALQHVWIVVIAYS